jgi:hypothetical protein
MDPVREIQNRRGMILMHQKKDLNLIVELDVFLKMKVQIDHMLVALNQNRNDHIMEVVIDLSVKKILLVEKQIVNRIHVRQEQKEVMIQNVLIQEDQEPKGVVMIQNVLIQEVQEPKGVVMIQNVLIQEVQE